MYQESSGDACQRSILKGGCRRWNRAARPVVPAWSPGTFPLVQRGACGGICTEWGKGLRGGRGGKTNFWKNHPKVRRFTPCPSRDTSCASDVGIAPNRAFTACPLISCLVNNQVSLCTDISEKYSQICFQWDICWE
jgi:hypothetical protein